MLALEGLDESLNVPRIPVDAHVIIFGALIVILSAVLVDDGTLGDVATTWNVYVVSTITAEAVPEMSPVDDKVSPGGNDPDAMNVSKDTTPPLELDACN